jgi:hypothetical protein
MRFLAIRSQRRVALKIKMHLGRARVHHHEQPWLKPKMCDLTANQQEKESKLRAF